ncbi:Chromosome partition protein Smc [Austwickia sp. TVS 96-490-7B]|uniref:YhgE/Pip domain-containing protein n=1 Tax=Austwickia sp. TVS 96-490-7B TaxID=2830843 RepID=UPI001C5A4F66|nr:YhgE/Pip domain-containing protein [Austwickia sp. TVS 96-490-7B]MBW3086532.1 Chromosome partition protein Smc [Austwickia sp. TVS 96-490-7B]
MFAWTSHGTELKRFARQPITRAAVAVMLLIPLLYGAMYVWAFWDPTSSMDRLPVALINDDVPTTVDGERLAAGEKTTNTLLERKPFQWHQTSQNEARDGIDSGKYYFAVRIPSTYSSDIASLKSDKPRTAHLDVTYDDTNSFLASTLGRSAMTQIKEAINEVSGTEAVDKVLVGLGKTRDGMGNASDGAFRLNEALGKIEQGTDKLNVSSGQLRDGAAKLAEANGKISDGLKTVDGKVKPLPGQINQLSGGTGQLVKGLDTLNAGMPKLADGSKELADKATLLSQKQAQYVEGLSKAGDGAKKMHEGSAKLSQLGDATKKLDAGAQKLAAGSTTLAAGADKAAAGAQKLAGATGPQGELYTGATKVSSGASELSQKMAELNTELAPGGKLHAALSSPLPLHRQAALAKLQEAMQKLTAGTGQLSAGATAVSEGIYSTSGKPSLNAGLTALAGPEGLQGLVGGAHALNNGLTSTNPASPGLAPALHQLAGSTNDMSGIQGLINGLASLDEGMNNPDPTKGLVAGGKALSQANGQLAGGAQKISGGVSTVAGGVTQLDQGAHQLHAGVNSASQKVPALVDALGQLDSGAQQAAAGADKLRQGTALLAGKTPELKSGVGKAKDGSGELASKLADGKNQIPSDQDDTRRARAAAINNPVSMSTEDIHRASSWGEGFSPFFIGIALWVGALITWLLLRPLQTRALMTSVNGFRMAWGALNSALLLAVGQVFIMLAVMHFAIGLEPKNMTATIAFTMLCAFAFMALQQAFQVAFGSAVGKVIAIAMLMVQLASSGGTYPIETTPEFLRTINPYLPMSYLVSGLREAITGGLGDRFWTATLFMGSVFVVSLIVTSIASARKRIWTMGRLHPALSI